MLNLEKITAYKISSDLSDEVWNLVSSWSILAQRTIGEQLIKSIDSIPANIAEGEGRYFKKDKIKFFFQARGSLFEAIHWVAKTGKRKLLSQEQCVRLLEKLEKLPKEINFLIKNTSKNLKK